MNRLFVIGRNDFGQLGLGHTDNITKLTELKDSKIENISSVHSGHNFTIYSKDNNVYVSGHNRSGSCGVGQINDKFTECTEIEFFKQSNISIKSICSNIGSFSTFWIDKENNIYGNGYNGEKQLGLIDNIDKPEPCIISSLQSKNIINIQSTSRYSIALSVGGFICKMYYVNTIGHTDICYDILKLILFYADIIHLIINPINCYK